MRPKGSQPSSSPVSQRRPHRPEQNRDSQDRLSFFPQGPASGQGWGTVGTCSQRSPSKRDSQAPFLSGRAPAGAVSFWFTQSNPALAPPPPPRPAAAVPRGPGDHTHVLCGGGGGEAVLLHLPVQQRGGLAAGGGAQHEGQRARLHREGHLGLSHGERALPCALPTTLRVAPFPGPLCVPTCFLLRPQP